MDGLPSDAGDVRLGVLSDKMDSLRRSLQATDKYLYGLDKNTVDFLVSNLTHSSPTAISLRTQPIKNFEEHQQEIFLHFSQVVASITQGVYRATANHYLLECLKELIGGMGKNYSNMWLSFRGEVVANVTSETVVNLEKLLAKNYTSIGSIKGAIKKYNGQSEQKSFHIYPAIGARVKCIFEDSLLEKASGAVEQNVIVHGILKYQEGDFSPYEVFVDSIEVLPPNKPLGDLSSFQSSEDATDGKSSVEFIKNLRNGWH